eukprot:33825_1
MSEPVKPDATTETTPITDVIQSCHTDNMSVEPVTQQPIDSSSPSQNMQPSQTVSSSESSKRPSNRITRPVPPPVKRQKVEKSPTNSEKPSDKSSSSAKPRTQNSDGFKCGGCSQSFSAGSYL